MDELKEILLVLLGVMLIISVIGCASGGVIFVLASVSCDALAEINPKMEFHWGPWTGCLVKAPSGLWVDSDNIHLIERMPDGKSK